MRSLLVALRPRILDRRRTVVIKSDFHRMSVIVVLQRAIAIFSAGPLRHSNSQRQRHLELVHSLLGLVLINGAPNLRWPMVVELMRILQVKRLVDVKVVISAVISSDGSGV